MMGNLHFELTTLATVLSKTALCPFINLLLKISIPRILSQDSCECYLQAPTHEGRSQGHSTPLYIHT